MYNRIRQVQYLYAEDGYRNLSSLPWVVSKKAAEVCGNADPSKLAAKQYHPSTPEEMIIQHLIDVKNKNPQGKFQAAGPCILGDIQSIQVGLVDFTVTDVHLQHMINIAYGALGQFVPVRVERELFGAKIFDEKFGTLLGEYGLRETEKLGTWLYGTGTSEPTLSKVIAQVYDFERKV